MKTTELLPLRLVNLMLWMPIPKAYIATPEKIFSLTEGKKNFIDCGPVSTP